MKFVGQDDRTAILEGPDGQRYRVEVVVVSEPIRGSSDVLSVAYLGDRVSWQVTGRENNPFQSWPDHTAHPVAEIARSLHFGRLRDFPEVLFTGRLEDLLQAESFRPS